MCGLLEKAKSLSHFKTYNSVLEINALQLSFTSRKGETREGFQWAETWGCYFTSLHVLLAYIAPRQISNLANSRESILGDPGVDSGAEDEIKTGGKNFDEQKHERKMLVEGFPARFDFVFGPTIYPWVSADEEKAETLWDRLVADCSE